LESLLRAILYVRVSTEEQAKNGFSLKQQLEALRRYCKENNIEIVAEFEDRASGAYLDRPGLDTLRDVVSSGGIDIVLSQDRDRFSREPAYRFLLEQEFKEHGTKIRSLNDKGDGSHEGDLQDGILDQVAKYERAMTAERTRRGRVRKAQEGKVVGNGSAPFGFYYEDDFYHIDPERMPYARQIFERAAAGESLYSIVEHLNNIGAPSPKGGRWHASTIRWIISSDIYLGTFYWNKEKYSTITIPKIENGKRTYKRKVVKEKRPESEWISIPVPDSDIPPETIARARDHLQENIKSVSKNGGRTWELSGGVAKCSECGRHMVAHTSRNSEKRTYYYYRCSSRKHHACSNRKNYPARDLEMWVKDAIVEAFQPDAWEGFVNDLCDIKLADLNNLHHSDPVKTKEKFAKRIEDLKTKISRAQDLYIDSKLSRPQYEEKEATFQDEIEVVEQELSKVDNLDDEIRRVEGLRRLLLSTENPLSGHYEFIPDPDDDCIDALLRGNKDNLVNGFGHGLGYGSKETAAKRRQEFYRKVGIRVKVGEELEISLGIDQIIVRKNESVSGVTAAPAPVGVPGSLSRPLS
jgi:site-specific DNA recombinase